VTAPGDPLYDVGYAIAINVDVTSAASVAQGSATSDAVMPIVQRLVDELARARASKPPRPAYRSLAPWDRDQIKRGVSVLQVIADGLALLAEERP
jgi:hypothetical protein